MLSQRNNRKTKAFTLIELLVVISIIALLLSILLPAMSRVKEQARRVVCGNQLRQISFAMGMYQNNNKGWLPPNAGFDSWPKPNYQPHFYGNFNITTGLDRGQSGAAVMASYVDPIIFFCPSSNDTARVKKGDKKTKDRTEGYGNPYPYRVPEVKMDRNGKIVNFVNYPWNYLTYNYAIGYPGPVYPQLNGRDCKTTRDQARNGKLGILLIDIIIEKDAVQNVVVNEGNFRSSGNWENHLKTSKGPGGNRLLTDGSCTWQTWSEDKMKKFWGKVPNGYIYW